MSVQQEMQKLTKIKTKAGESRQDFLTRIILAMAEPDLVSDDAIKTMSPEADEWYKAAGGAYDQQEPLPDFPDQAEPEVEEESVEPQDFPEEDEPASDEEDEDMTTAATETTKTKSASKGAAKKAVAAPAAKKVAAKKAVAAKPAAANNGKQRAAAPRERASGEGARGQITAWLIKNPKLTNEQIHERLKKQGNKTSFVTVKSTRSALKSFISELKKAGHKINVQV